MLKPKMQPETPRASYAALLALVLLHSSPAWAHGGLQGSTSLWGGIQHWASSPLTWASLCGVWVALMGVSERLVLPLAVLAGAAAGLGAALAGYFPAYVAPATIVVVGLCAVAAYKPSNTGAMVLALISGMAGGVAADLDVPSWPGVIGVTAAEMFALGCALAAGHDLTRIGKLQTVLPIARRVVGSWVAAMGLLMAVLAIHNR
jgi:hypothetical protein